VLGIKFAY